VNGENTCKKVQCIIYGKYEVQCSAHFVFAHNRRNPVILNKIVIAPCKIKILKLVHKRDHRAKTIK
jgi:hypothetical protein